MEVEHGPVRKTICSFASRGCHPRNHVSSREWFFLNHICSSDQWSTTDVYDRYLAKGEMDLGRGGCLGASDVPLAPRQPWQKRHHELVLLES